MRLRTWPVVVLAAMLATTPLRAAADAGDPAGTDPLQGMNRGIFWFNDQVDTYVFVPVAKGWNWIVPQRVQRALSNMFANANSSVDLVNNVLQAKPKATAIVVARLMINTTFGVAGLFDLATDWGLERPDEDLGQTFGYWGIPPGPYLVLPLLGPSSPRDGVGLLGDSFAAVYPWLAPFAVTTTATGVGLINRRSQALTTVEELKAASVDYYVAVRNAYRQRRQAQIDDQQGMSEETQQDLYSLDVDEEETGNGR